MTGAKRPAYGPEARKRSLMTTRTFFPPAETTESTRDQYRALQLTDSELMQMVNVGHPGGYVSFCQAGDSGTADPASR